MEGAIGAARFSKPPMLRGVPAIRGLPRGATPKSPRRRILLNPSAFRDRYSGRLHIEPSPAWHIRNMRVLLNGLPMLGRVTGVGQYGLRLMAALRRMAPAAGVDEIGVFNGRAVVSPEEFLAGLATGGGIARRRKSWIKPLIRSLVPGSRQLLEAWRTYRIGRHAQRARWNLFHETNFVSPKLGLPLVTTVHDMGYLRYPQYMPRDRVRWLARRLGPALARSRAILADSHFTRDELLQLCPQVLPERVYVAQLGVDVGYFSDPAHGARLPEVRRRLGLPAKFALYLGTLEPRKNLQGLVRGYASLPTDLQREYPLVLAGMSGWRQEYFRRELDVLRARGVVYEPGYVADADVPVLMKAASVFCFPSLYEGFGLPPLEAAACGTPVLCSRAASLPEVMGPAAVYVDPHSPQEIAAGLETLFTDASLRASLAAAGPQRAAAFTWQSCARHTLNAYRAAA